MSIDRLSVSASPASSNDPRSVGGFLDALRNQGAAPPTKVASSNRPGYHLDPTDRWRSPEYQHELLTRMHFLPVGTFELRLNPRAYGIPLDAILEYLDRFRAAIRTNELGPELLDLMFVQPLQVHGRTVAPLLIAENPNLPPEFKEDARILRVYTETVFTDVKHGSDKDGRYVSIVGTVYARPAGWMER